MELLKHLFENADLPSDFKEKTTTLFEAAVDEKVKAQIVSIQESYDAKVDEAKAAYIAEATATIDAVVEETVLEWAKENAVALDSQVKGQLAASFLTGLRGIFEQADIELNSDTAGTKIAELTEATAAAEARAAAAQTALVEAEQKLVQHQIKEIIESKTAGLADTVAHRVAKLCEAFEFKTAEDFKVKVDMVMEAVAGIKGTVDTDGTIVPVTSTTKATSNNVSTEAGTHAPEDGELVVKPGANSVKSAEGDKGIGTKVAMDPLKEAYDAQRDQYAPHLGADMVAETLKLFR
jgi:hypothetical protein